MSETAVRTDAETADTDEEAVWIVEGYDPENLEPVRAGDVMYAPGVTVTFADEHEMYPGEEGVVQAVGKGTGFNAGGIVYDVLVEGTTDAERVSEHDLEG